MEDLRRITHGVLVRVRPKAGRVDEVEELMDAVLQLSDRELHTETSLLMRFEDEFALLDLFRDERSRREHLYGAARQAIAYRARDLFDHVPDNTLLDVVDHVLPTVAGRARLTNGTLLTFATAGDPVGAADGRSGDVLQVSAASDAAWLAMRFPSGAFAVVDLTTAPQGPEPARLPEVCRNGQEVRLLSSERFRLVGPDVAEPPVTVTTPRRAVVPAKRGTERSGERGMELSRLERPHSI